MKIFGIGTDIVSVRRIEQSMERHGYRFAEKVLSSSELKEFAGVKEPSRFLAKRFAAKEAVAKALGTGFRNGLIMKDIVIAHNDLGKPEISYNGYASNFVIEKGITGSLISLSDERESALAFVTLICS